MAQLASNLVQEPFGEVNAWVHPDGTIEVKATVLMKPVVEHARTGLAIDASASMAEMFGCGKQVISNIFGELCAQPNYVEPVARKMTAYLAEFDSTGETTVIYYSLGRQNMQTEGKAGSDIHFIGNLDAERSQTQKFEMPPNTGAGTCLTPAIKYFLNSIDPRSWFIGLFITDGMIDDADEVKALSKQICEEMAEGKRGYTKFVIIGLGREFHTPDSAAARLLEELDDLDNDPTYGVPGQDLWDHKLAFNMKSMEEIFAEVVSSNIVLCRGAEVTDSNGLPVTPKDSKSYEKALPALLHFTMSPGSTAFTLALPNGNRATQDISPLL